MHNVDAATAEKILKNFDVPKTSGINHICANFREDGAPVIAIHLANIINLSIKPDAFPSKFKVPIIKTLFKKGIKTEAKKYRPISLLSLISKVIEKSIHDQTQDYL